MSGPSPAPLTGDQIAELTSLLRAALVSDALDVMGLRRQCLGADLLPLNAGRVVVGNAFPIQATTVMCVPDAPYTGLLRALDAVEAGDVVVFACDGSAPPALWGELLSHACQARGAVGAVCDGYVRDSAQVRSLGFPVHCLGTVPLDINGRAEVVRHGDEVVVDGVRIAADDLVVADDDGVVIVPLPVRDEAVARALQKSSAETGFRDAVDRGLLPSEAFARHNVL